MLSLANQGLPIYFPPGYYNTSISLENTSSVTIKFDEVILAGHLQITNNSERIKINGSVTILDKLFIVQSRDISFEKVIVKSNQTQNIYEQKNRGVSIYAGSKNIKFDSLSLVILELQGMTFLSIQRHLYRFTVGMTILKIFRSINWKLITQAEQHFILQGKIIN